jgi:hypothetical protein
MLEAIGFRSSSYLIFRGFLLFVLLMMESVFLIVDCFVLCLKFYF